MFATPLLPHSRCALLACLLTVGGTCQTASAHFDFPDLGEFGGTAAGNLGAEVAVDSEFAPATTDRGAMLFVTLNVGEGYHVYAVDQGALPNGGGGPKPTKFLVAAGEPARVVGPWTATRPPHTRVDQTDGVDLELREHSGQVTWYAPLEFDPGTDASSLSIAVHVEGQACDPHTCIPFETTVTAKQGPGVPIPVAPQPATEAKIDSGRSLLSVVGYALLGGLILNLMPCVLPVIGLKILSFAKQGGQSRAQIFFLNLSYVAGMLLVFLVLATLASLVQLGLGDESLGWGELNTHTWFKVSMASLVFAMALSFLGIWEIPIPGFASSSTATDLAAREGPLGAFMMGVFTTILATPCSGPFLGPTFGYLISQPVHITYTVFASVGLGMALPYLLIGMVPSLVSWLPKPGAWMDTFKQLMAFVLLGTVVWLCSAIPADYFIATLSLLFGIWFACWWVGRTPLTASSAAKMMAWLGGAAVASVVGVAGFQFSAPSDSALPWQPYSQAALAEARGQGKTVLVDFTADWCANCKVNLRLAINRQEVKNRVEQNGVVTLLADWSDKDPAIKRALLELNSPSIPLLVVYPADSSRQPIVLPDLLSKETVLNALSDAGPSADFEPTREVAITPSSSGAGKPAVSNLIFGKSAVQ